MTFGQWIQANQTIITAVITILVTAVWTPFVRKLPQTSWVWVLIRAVLAGVPKEPVLPASEAKKEDPHEEVTGPIPPTPPSAA